MYRADIFRELFILNLIPLWFNSVRSHHCIYKVRAVFCCVHHFAFTFIEFHWVSSSVSLPGSLSFMNLSVSIHSWPFLFLHKYLRFISQCYLALRTVMNMLNRTSSHGLSSGLCLPGVTFPSVKIDLSFIAFICYLWNRNLSRWEPTFYIP